MAELNNSFLSHQGPTDVITFDYREDDEMFLDEDETFTLGEVIICPQVAAEACQEHGSTFGEELMLYVVHGFLHLAGYDDHEPEDRQAMRDAEQLVMTPLLQAFPINSMFVTGAPGSSCDELDGAAEP